MEWFVRCYALVSRHATQQNRETLEGLDYVWED